MGNLISIITVNYNGLNDTMVLLRSLYSIIKSVPFEVIVVDNGSIADESVIISQEFPLSVCVRSDINLGFAGGNNLGIKKAKGDYLFFINNDTYIEEDNFDRLIDTFKAYPNTGGVSPLIRFAFDNKDIQFAGYTPLSKVTLRNSLIGFGLPPSSSLLTPAYTPYLHGAAMLFKKEVIEKAGVMPELYFLYYEELDWCAMITRAGFRLRFNPDATVYHKESRSTGCMSALRTYYLTRNRLLYAWRNCDEYEKYLSLIYQTLIVIPKDITVAILKRRFDIVKAIIKRYVDFYPMPNKKM